MADIKAIKGTNGTTYDIVDRYSKWGGNNLLKNIPKSSAPTSYNFLQLDLTENLVAGETYTLQLWNVDVYHSAKAAAQTGVWVYWGGGSVNLFNWAGTGYFTAGTNNYHADHLTYTFTVTSSQAFGNGATNLWLNLYNSVPSASGTMNATIEKWKLEKGHKATDWSPCWADIFTYASDTITMNI